jgi:hypothetical protein
MQAETGKSGWDSRKRDSDKSSAPSRSPWKLEGLKFVYLTSFQIGSSAFILPLSFNLCSCQAKEELLLLRNLVNCTKCPLL